MNRETFYVDAAAVEGNDESNSERSRIDKKITKNHE